MSKNEKSLLQKTEPGICIGSRLKILSRNVENIYRKHLGPYSITSSQLSILFFVAKNEEVRQKDIGKFLILERSTVCRDLTRLIRNGLIAKNRTELRSTVALTKAGGSLLEEVIPSWKMAHEESSELLGEHVMTEIDNLVSRIRC